LGSEKSIDIARKSKVPLPDRALNPTIQRLKLTADNSLVIRQHSIDPAMDIAND
jgi:hypothetical protein